MTDRFRTGDDGLFVLVEKALSEYFGKPCRVVRFRHQPALFSSSYPIEEISLELQDGTSLDLLYKNLGQPLEGALPSAKPSFVTNPGREPAVYRSILASAGLGTAICYGTVQAPGRRGLILERVEGFELFQSGDLEVWCDVARWLAALHGSYQDPRTLPTTVPLIRHDAAYYRRWPARALCYSAGRTRNAVARVVSRHEDLVERLKSFPSTLIHGEFYPSNILLRRPAGGVCPIDWEMAGFGPGIMDLAALVGGRWSSRERQALADAYRAAAKTELQLKSSEEFRNALSCCRLQLAIQWLGWSRDWSPPPEHRYDWLSEALLLVEQLEL